MSSMVGPRAWVARWGPPRATHPTEVVTVSMYIIPVASSCTMQLVHIMATVSSIVVSSPRGSRDALRVVANDRSLCRQAITFQKPGGDATSCTISRGLVGDVDSCFVSSTCWHSSALWHQALLPPDLWLWGLCFDSQGIRGACPVAVTSQEGCNTSLQPGNWVGDPAFLVGSSPRVWEVMGSSRGLSMGAASSAVAPSMGVGGSWLDTLTNGYLQLVLQGSLQWITPLKMVSSEKVMYGSITSLSSRMLPAKRCGWPRVGGLDFFAQDWRICA